MQEQSIFIEALEREDPGERSAYLDRACAGDLTLRRRIERLLDRHREPDPFLEYPARELAATLDALTVERPHARIGPYRLLQQLGEGGMGVVFLADQLEPVQRQVALKIIKPGMDSRRVLARFEAERQALALMDHPNIARVLDAGTIEPISDSRFQISDFKSEISNLKSEISMGRPYFVMELVKGIPITSYCDEHHLTPRQRLELFMPVCQAIQHAHQKGIIHRDLKPSNVLIMLQDDKPVPKIIDFGVAKATGPKLTEATVFTEFGQIVGTLEYMSPEQAELNQLDIDTRSDIYTLGVLLYELLTGTTPLCRKRLADAAFPEMLRLIREEEPPRPSTRLSTTAELPAIAANRGLEPKKLHGVVRGELDWIVMKALEKDRNRRYETANGLARDLQRYLADEPVQACPPSATYRMRKLVRRHRGAVLAAAAMALLLVAGIVGTTIGLLRALAAEGKAVQALHRADDEARIARAVSDFLQQDLLTQASSTAQANQGFAADPNLTVREALDRAAARIGHRFQEQPLVEAAIRTAIGDAYQSIGEARLGVPHLERARGLRDAHLGPNHPDTLDTMNSLALAYLAVGRIDEAILLDEQTLARRRETLGPDDPDTLTSMNNLAYGLQYAGRLERVLPLFEETLAKRQTLLGPDHPDTLTSVNNLAWAYQQAGRLDRALPLYEDTLARRQHVLGPNHPDTLTSMDNLAWGSMWAGKLDRAIALYKQALAKKRQQLGPNHPETLACMAYLGVTYRLDGQSEKAISLLEEALAKQRGKFGPDHLDTIQTIQYLAGAYDDSGEFERAAQLYDQALRKQQQTFGSDHPQTLSCKQNLAGLCWKMNRWDQSISLWKECYQLQRARFGRDHPEALFDLMYLGAVLRDAGRLDDARRCLEEALATARRRPGDLPALLAPALGELADVYERNRQPAKAEPLYREYLQYCRGHFGADDLHTAASLELFGASLLRRQRYTEAESLLRESLAIRAKKRPDHWEHFRARSRLGELLVHRKNYAEAEQLLRTGYEGLERHAAKIPPLRRACLSEARERLVQLYDAWGQKDEAAKWHRRRTTSAPVPPHPHPLQKRQKK